MSLDPANIVPMHSFWRYWGKADENTPGEQRYFRKGQRSGKLAICTFEGIAQVSSPERLTVLLENGVRHAKAFGCGLLLVRRLD